MPVGIVRGKYRNPNKTKQDQPEEVEIQRKPGNTWQSEPQVVETSEETKKTKKKDK